MKKAIAAVEMVNRFFGYAAGALVIAMMALIMYEVFMRFVINRPPGYAVEMSGYMLIGIAFLALAYTWKEKGHVRVEALVSNIPRRIAKWIRLAMLILALAFMILCTQVTYAFLVDVYHRQIISMTQLRIFLLWPTIPFAIGFTLLCLQLVVDIIKSIAAIKEARGEEVI